MKAAGLDTDTGVESDAERCSAATGGTAPPRDRIGIFRTIWGLFDATALNGRFVDPRTQQAQAARWLPYVVLHGGCLGVIWVGWSWTAVWVAAGLYLIRMFAITGFYHRYFSHRSFRTSRAAQFVFALLGNSAAQRGPIWWASQHRMHHQHSDDPFDAHSPKQHGFWWAHIGWLTAPDNLAINPRVVRDLTQFPELRFLDRFDTLVPLALMGLLFAIGTILSAHAPQLGTSGLQLLVWGFFVSTVVCFHCTCFINSLAHVYGSRPFVTTDTSRNSLLLALLTLGEGWHNNHHRFPGSARQGFLWWEIDITFYVLKLLEKLGIIWDVRPVPIRVLKERGRPSERCEADGT